MDNLPSSALHILSPPYYHSILSEMWKYAIAFYIFYFEWIVTQSS